MRTKTIPRRHPAATLTLVLGLIGAGAGCRTVPDARYVYQDGEFGVVGIPRNSPFGRKNYDEQARALMARHFPDGYEIVRAEEVVAGERTLDRAIKQELETEPGLAAFNQIVKLGKIAHSSSVDEKDVTHITESRILYRRRDDGKVAASNGYARVADQGPALYLDPNGLARRMDGEAVLLARKLETAKDAHKDQSPAARQDERKTEVARAGSVDAAVSRASVDPTPGP